jgi:hypothetical protein
MEMESKESNLIWEITTVSIVIIGLVLQCLD